VRALPITFTCSNMFTHCTRSCADEVVGVKRDTAAVVTFCIHAHYAQRTPLALMGAVHQLRCRRFHERVLTTVTRPIRYIMCQYMRT